VDLRVAIAAALTLDLVPEWEAFWVPSEPWDLDETLSIYQSEGRVFPPKPPVLR